MNAAPPERVDEMRSIIHAVLGGTTSKGFLVRIEAALSEWAEGKITAADAVGKIRKLVGLFIDEDKARQIGDRCAIIVMREAAAQKK